VQESAHAHAADVITLSEGLTLALADALHAHTADGELTLTQDWLLTIADALHAHAADNLDLGTEVTLVVSDTLHAHYADMVRWVRPVTPGTRSVVLDAADRIVIVSAARSTMVVIGGPL
jgi:hypothetical protein